MFVIYHTVSGFLDSLDGILARSLDQTSLVGRYFEYILDEYAHFVMYACTGLLYPSYIVYFYLEIALELWNSHFNLYVYTLPGLDKPWLHRETFLSKTCPTAIYSNPNLRLFNWYGPDVFHVLLILRYILINQGSRKEMTYIKRFISIDNFHLLFKLAMCFTGFFSVLRTIVTSCFMVDKLERMGSVN